MLQQQCSIGEHTSSSGVVQNISKTLERWFVRLVQRTRYANDGSRLREPERESASRTVVLSSSRDVECHIVDGNHDVRTK
jgi:hypothetical protein